MKKRNIGRFLELSLYCTMGASIFGMTTSTIPMAIQNNINNQNENSSEGIETQTYSGEN